MEDKLSLGRAYLNELGLVTANSGDAAVDNVAKACSNDKAMKLAKILNERSDALHAGKNYDSGKLYKLKNSDFKMAMVFTGAVDGDIIAHVCDWIAAHTDEFGEEVLEIGCDTGILSCFLGRMLPHSHITAIDVYDKSIAVAEQLAKKLNVTNVEFKRANAAKLDKQFDTVFSCRTMHENQGYVDEKVFYMMKDYGHMFEQALTSYAGTLAKFVTADGNLISIERTEVSPLFLGWLGAVNGAGLAPIEGTWEEIKCRECGQKTPLQVQVFRTGEKKTDDEIFDYFFKICFPGIITVFSQAQEWVASALLQKLAGELIEGYMVSYPVPGGKPFACYTLWSNTADATSLIFEEWNKGIGKHQLSNYYMNMKMEQLQALRSAMKVMLEQKMIVQRVKFVDGKLIAGDVVKIF